MFLLLRHGAKSSIAQEEYLVSLAACDSSKALRLLSSQLERQAFLVSEHHYNPPLSAGFPIQNEDVSVDRTVELAALVETKSMVLVDTCLMFLLRHYVTCSIMLFCLTSIGIVAPSIIGSK